MADIVVVGGGPAGCAFAVAAVRCGHRVTLLDEGRRLRTWPGEALPAGGGELAASVFGADVLDGHAPAYGTAASWGSAEVVDQSFMAHWSGHGWHLDRAAFDASLRAVAQAAGVTVVTERMSALEGDAGDWRVNGRWAGEWLVDASGRAGAVVSRMDIARIRVDEQVALVGTVADRGGERVTTVEAVRDGWWYTAPLPGGRRVVAYVTDADLVTDDRSRRFAESLAETHHVRSIAGSVDGAEVHAYPADTTYRESLTGPGWLAVGDAAVAFDPLSSQGLVTGIVMAARAGAMLADGLDGWAEDYRRVLDEHIALRAEFSRAEGRWPESDFWRRRQEDLSPAPR
ncbi:MAG: NAD(P)/FAD-dependent oxidoreductase [bacterium]